MGDLYRKRRGFGELKESNVNGHRGSGTEEIGPYITQNQVESE